MKILVVDAWLPTPDRDSASLRMFALLQVLREFGEVTFAADDFAARRSGLEQVLGLGVRVIAPPIGVEDELRAHGIGYEVVFLSRVQVAEKYFAAARELAPRAKLIFDTTDLAYVRGFRGAKALGNVSLLRRALALKKTELALVRAAEMTLVVSAVEQATLGTDCPEAQVRVVSNIQEVVPSAVPYGEREGILFVGTFSHLPNTDGMQWFCDVALPRVREQLGGVKVTVVGSHPPDRLKALDAADFVVAQHVSDLAPLLDRCRVMIAPLRFGAGVKGKVLLGMGYGVPVVGTTMAAEGIPVTQGRDMLIADEGGVFADAVVKAYTDETLWNTLARNGARVVEENFSRAVARAALEKIFRELEVD